MVEYALLIVGLVRATLRNVLNQHELMPRLRPTAWPSFAPLPRPTQAPAAPWALPSLA